MRRRDEEEQEKELEKNEKEERRRERGKEEEELHQAEFLKYYKDDSRSLIITKIPKTYSLSLNACESVCM